MADGPGHLARVDFCNYGSRNVFIAIGGVCRFREETKLLQKRGGDRVAAIASANSGQMNVNVADHGACLPTRTLSLHLLKGGETRKARVHSSAGISVLAVNKE